MRNESIFILIIIIITVLVIIFSKAVTDVEKLRYHDMEKLIIRINEIEIRINEKEKTCVITKDEILYCTSQSF